MIHLDRVLFATDGSECAETARRHAFPLADRFEAALHVIQVVERQAELTDVIEVREEDVLANLHSLGGAETRVATPRIRECQVIHPSAAGGILAYAAEHDIDLLVLGTHGRRGLRRLVLGSVAEKVVRRAPRPVLTAGRDAKPPEGLEGGHLLVPIDFSEYQTRLLAHARELALAYDMTLTLLHAVELEEVPNVYGVFRNPPEPEVLADRMRVAVEEEAEELRESDVDVRVDIRSGHPAPQILQAARELDIDLLAIATHGRSGIDRMLMGSVAEKVIRQAPCPVFTVKSLGPSIVPENRNVDTEGESLQ